MTQTLGKFITGLKSIMLVYNPFRFLFTDIVVLSSFPVILINFLVSMVCVLNLPNMGHHCLS